MADSQEDNSIDALELKKTLKDLIKGAGKDYREAEKDLVNGNATVYTEEEFRRRFMPGASRPDPDTRPQQPPSQTR